MFTKKSESFGNVWNVWNVWDTETTYRLSWKQNQTLPPYSLSLQHYWGADSATTAVFEAFLVKLIFKDNKVLRLLQKTDISNIWNQIKKT